MINDLLIELKENIEKNSNLTDLISDGEIFENYVYEELKKMAKSSKFNLVTVKHNGKHSFPDLSLIFSDKSIYGLEIKFSASGNWRSKGNSVFESLSNKESNENAYTEIYVFFGRKPKKRELTKNIEVRFGPYGSNVDRIEVTHSPRFAINMNNDEQNISDLFGENSTYAEFRLKSNEEKNELLRQYFIKQHEDGSTDKWYIPKPSEVENTGVEPALLKSLSEIQKTQIISEAFILYPNDLFRKRANYDEIAINMLSRHFVYDKSFRDNFSSGGKVIINDSNLKYPQMLQTFSKYVKNIKDILKNPPYEEFEKQCYLNWEKHFSDIHFDHEDELEYSYEKIIKSFKPILEVEEVESGITKDIQIDLTEFYPLKY